jgi:integrase/recombinase XerD
MTEQFIQERLYLTGVSPKTVIWYRMSFRQFAGALASKGEMVDRIKVLKDRGASHITINSYLRAANAYFHWRDGKGEKCSPQCTHIHIPRLKEEQKILATLSPEQIKRLVQFKPVKRNETRVHVMALCAMDTGLRLGELLRLRRQDVDLDNLVLRVHGKGDKHRLVPVSIELRKVLFRYLSRQSSSPSSGLVFCTVTGTSVSIHNSDRDFKILYRKLNITGVRTSFHPLRHTMATNYLRAGGNLYYLQRILGHSSITTTERYVRSLGIADIQKVHDGLSLLSSM